MRKKVLLLLLSVWPLGMPLYAQEATKPFWGKQEVYLMNQTQRTFHLVEELLKENPPSLGNIVLARKAALQLLDGIFHDTRLDGSEAISQFMESRLEKLLVDLQKPLNEGMKIYKLYNDGFIVKTKSCAVAFDLYRGGVMKDSSSLISDETMKKIVSLCDIMFLSHNHPDHIDPVVVKMFTDQGKQVVAPDNGLTANEKVTHIRSEQILGEKFKIKGGTIDVKILPGHQSELVNNIYVVTTAENYTFAHTGDQYNEKDLEWLLQVKTKIPVLDVLLINCWAKRLADTVDGFNPKLVITGHENELGHTIDHRESYWTSILKLEEVRKPSCLMTWGEMYWYK